MTKSQDEIKRLADRLDDNEVSNEASDGD